MRPNFINENYFKPNLSILLGFILIFTAGCGIFDGDGDGDGDEPISDISSFASISVSEGALSPAFTLGGTEYSVEVESAVESIQITVVLESDVATLQINGESAVSRQASSPINLNVGANTIQIVGTAENGATRAVTITVNRAEQLSSNDFLSGLTISSGELTPSFVNTTNNYTVAVGSETESITLTPITDDPNASVTVNQVEVDSGIASNAIGINEGENTIEVQVTAEDGSTVNVYSIVVNRAVAVSSDATLSAISLSVGSISPVFDASVNQYSVSVSYSNTSIAVTPILNDSTATVTVNGEMVESGAASSQIALLEGSNTISIIVTAEDGATTNNVDIAVTRQAIAEFAQEAYLKASNTGATDAFGRAHDSDGNTLVVGASFEDSSGSGIDGDQSNNLSLNSGAVYVFVRNYVNDEWVWSQQAYIKPPEAVVNGRFGYSVAISEDTIAVGALYYNGNASFSGAVYVFTRTNGVWTQQQKVRATIPGDDGFGWSVDIEGDELAVGAIYEDSNATGINGDATDNSVENTGAAYVFTRTAGVWTQRAYVKAAGNDIDDHFGWQVAIDDGTLIVSADQEESNAVGIDGDAVNNDAPNSGAVYVFTASGDSWSQQAYIKASNANAGDQFGRSVDLHLNTLVVGASAEDSQLVNGEVAPADNGSQFSGAVYVFNRTAGVWTQTAFLKSSNTEPNDFFGEFTAIQGNSILVGAAGEDSAATGIDGDQSDNSVSNSGAVYLFGLVDGQWVQQSYIKSSNGDVGDTLSWVSFGSEFVVVGSDMEDSNATGINGDQGDNSSSDSGAVYIISGGLLED